MKKKLLSFVFAVCLIAPCLFMLSACGGNPPDNAKELTNAEMSVVYKEIAISTWSEIGVADPTTETTASDSISASSVPDKKQETANVSDLSLIKMNSNNMASILYLIGLLYENPNFVLSNGVVKFDGVASVDAMEVPYNYTFTLKPQLDIENNKVYLEAYTVANGSYEQYIVIDANYNFITKTMLSFRMYAISGGMYLDLGITEDDEYKIYSTMDTADTMAVAIDSEFTSFKNSVQNTPKLNTLFSEEIQAYMTLSQKVAEELGG